MILKMGGLAPSARLIGMGAEAIPADLLEKIDRVSQIRKVVNYYGPTETTVYCTCSVVLDRDDPRHTLDFAIGDGSLAGQSPTRASMSSTNMDTWRRPARRANSISRERPLRAATSTRSARRRRILAPTFSCLNWANACTARGDLVCLRSDGQLEFLGRKDGQFKFNGVRIESAEIENALHEFPGVRQAVVELGTDAEGKKRVVAYLAADGAKLSKSEVRRMLRQRLPDAMIPHHFFFLDALPVTTNGKVDRRALALLRLEAQPAAGSSAALTSMEKRMTALWEKNLSRSPIGPHDDYFEMGGDSLSAVNLVAAIEKQFGLKLKPSVLLDNASVAELVRAIENPYDKQGSADSGPVCGFTALQESGDGAPLVI